MAAKACSSVIEFEPASRHYISRLSLVETVSAFAGKCRMQHIDEWEFDMLRRRFYDDIGQGHGRMLPKGGDI
jgi:hypothetical protein